MRARARNALVTLALLAATAAALAIAFYAVERPMEREKAAQEAEEKVLAVGRDEVRALRLAGKGPEVRLERAGDGWRVTAPLEAPADRAAAEALLDAALELRRRQRVAEPDAGLASFGLSPPRMRLTLELAGGGTRELEVGDENPFDGSLFVRAGGPVVAVAPGARYSLEKGLFDLREKQLFPVEEKDLVRLELKGPRIDAVLVRQGGEWRLSSPIAERADRAAVGRLASALRGLRATRFDDAPGPAAGYGLDRPRFEVTARGPGETVRTLELGEAPEAPAGASGKPSAAKAAAGKSGDEKQAAGKPAADMWARVSGSRSLAAVPGSVARDLDLDLWALRDKALLRFDMDKVAAIRVERGAEALEARRGPPAPDGGPSPDWALTAPRAAPAAAWKLSGLLYALEGLQAARFADERGMRLAEHGLSPPSAVVTLLGAGGETLARLEVGKASGEETFVRGSASPRIAAVPTSSLSQIPRGPEDLAEPKAGGTEAGKDGGPRQGG
jgi:hypothetical protein